MYKYKYEFVIEGFYEEVARAMSVFMDNGVSPLTTQRQFETDKITWGNVPGGPVDNQRAKVVALFEQAIEPFQIDGIRGQFKNLAIDYKAV